MKMKEDSEKERLEQLEQEEIEKNKRLSRRSSSPVVRHLQQPETDVVERSAHSEPIPRITQFVSSSNIQLLAFSFYWHIFLIFLAYFLRRI